MPNLAFRFPESFPASLALALEMIAATRLVTEGDLVSALILACIVDANIGHLDDGVARSDLAPTVGAEATDALRRPIRCQRIAESLDVPRQTARAKVARLTELGLLISTPAGLILPSSVMTSEPFRPVIAGLLRAKVRFVARIGAAGEGDLRLGERVGEPVWSHSGPLVRVAIRHVLRTVDVARGLLPESAPLVVLIFMALLREATERRGAEFGHREVNARLLAESLGIPRETARRRFGELAAHGMLLSRHGAHALDLAALPGLHAATETLAADTRRAVRGLRQAGVLGPASTAELRHVRA